MYLLRVFYLTVLAISLSLVLPHNARAVDHPWDGNSPDTSHFIGGVSHIDTQAGDPIIPVIPRVLTWVRGVIHQYRIYFPGTTAKGQTAVIPKNSQDIYRIATITHRKSK